MITKGAVMSEHQKKDDKNKKQPDKQENKNEKKSSFWVKANITATLSLFAGITLSLLKYRAQRSGKIPAVFRCGLFQRRFCRRGNRMV